MSMSFIGAKYDEKGQLLPVYDLVKTLNERFYKDIHDPNDLGVDNPYYQVDADFNVNSYNAKYVIEDVLGYKIEDGFVKMEIIDLENRIIQEHDGAIVLDEYVDKFFARMLRLIDFAKPLGATHIYGA